MKANRLSIVSLFFSNGLVYGLNALYYSFMQIYLKQHHSDEIAGILLSVGPIVLIFAPVIWGMFADKAKSKNSVLAIAILGSAVFYFSLMFNQSFIYLAIMLAACMFFMSPFGSLVDIITLEYTGETGKQYGPFRVLGTLLYGLVPMILTRFTDNNINIIFPAYLCMALPTALSVMLSPKVAGHSAGRKKLNIAPLFKDHKLLILFFFAAASQFSWAYYLNFFPSHLESITDNYQQIWGINTFLTVLGEIPFFLAFNKLFEKLSMKFLLLFSIISTILRYLGLALLTNVPALLVLGCVTGLAVTIFTYCASYYIGKYVSPDVKASANSLLYALGNGIPKVLAGVLGGFMTASIGYTSSMLICMALNCAALVIFFFTFARYKLPKQGYDSNN